MHRIARQIARLFAALVLCAATAVPATAQNYRAYSCQDLWVARNQIFKDAGYCFKTSRATRFFGNAGCQFDSESRVPLSRGDRTEIDRIKRIENDKGCSD